MGRSLHLLILLALIPNLMKAQTKFQFSARAGLNYANNVIVEDNWNRVDDQREFRFGYHLGVGGRFAFTKKFSTSMEVNYSNLGYHSDGFESSDPPGPHNLNYNYLTVPVFIEYRPISRLTIQAGPQVGYLLSAKNRFETETIDLIEFWKSNGIDSIINRFDFGLGFGSEFKVNEKLLVGIRYFHGLSSLLDHNQTLFDIQGNPMPSPSIKEQNRNLQLSFAYLIW